MSDFQDYAETVKKAHTKLKLNALNFWEVSAHAFALISPTMTAALIVPLMFATAANAGWLCYLFGTVMLLFVALNLNQFAKRYTSAGSMYEYTVKGVGPTLGGISGFSLIWAYLFIGIAGVTGFTHFASLLLNQAGATGWLSHPYVTLFAICMIMAWFLAYKDITLSALMMLAMEGVSVFVILILALIACAKTGVIDSAQFHPFTGLGLRDIMRPLGLGVVVAIFSGVGFECATAFGEEAKKPLVTIPRAVIASLLFTGAFFIFITFVETHALATNNPTLDQLPAPLTTLSQNLGMAWMGIVIECGAMISFFALALSCLNSGSRIIFSMGRYGIFPISIGSTHKLNLTPHVAITSFALIQFLIPAMLMICVYIGHGASDFLQINVPLDVFNDAGTLGAMGFCGGYVGISLAAPFFLKKTGELKPHHILLSVIALILLLVPIVGLVWPVPLTPPMNLTPWIFGGYLLVGGIVVFVRRRSKVEFENVRKVLDENAMVPAMDATPAMPGDASPAMA